ncbi:MAG: PTS sugar transporter subunit IIA [Spirochaetia bacterium]|jgi:fructose-specific phosphotransferase system IIA component|nr:PTS sugar transporter subunit IIA [Spirochaetia bacterium]
MNLKKILNTNLVELDLKGNSKQEIIENLLDILVNTGKVKDRALALEALLEREAKMSTGIQQGVAIPHGKTDTVSELLACVGIVKDGMDFEALDGVPSKIFIMTLSPLTKSGPHVQFLADISRVLTSEGMREKLISSETKDELLSLIVKRPS